MGEPVDINVSVDPSRHSKLSFGLIRISDEGYPSLCPSGPAVVPATDGYVHIAWTPTDACPQAAIVVNHLDPNSSYSLGGDTYFVGVTADGGS
ncbi:hypothetical protein PO878_18910 [Iamia majanohamensis]|uniref:Uncharacterized protein n=1 Tax=Iamia majanohamensis TaxID=467976 RepID=A0AAE9Y8T0_9ACTN|nr:hypothetical protein [Iamia majanohamensis]WCO66573.1 hypothetical protein PO878_18910 [Iamia majanohamensis]